MKKIYKLSIFILSIISVTSCQIKISSNDDVKQVREVDDSSQQTPLNIIGVWEDQNVDLDQVELVIEDHHIEEEVNLTVSRFIVLSEDSFHSYFNIILSGDSDVIESTIIYPMFSDQGDTVIESYIERIKKVNNEGEVIYDLSYSSFGELIIEDETVGIIHEGYQSVGVTSKINGNNSIDTLSWFINDNDQLVLTLNEKVNINSDVENITGIYNISSGDEGVLIPEIVNLN